MRGSALGAERLVGIKPGVRVLYMSGYAMPTLGPTGTLEPGVDLVDKPFTESALLENSRCPGRNPTGSLTRRLQGYEP